MVDYYREPMQTKREKVNDRQYGNKITGPLSRIFLTMRYSSLGSKHFLAGWQTARSALQRCKWFTALRKKKEFKACNCFQACVLRLPPVSSYTVLLDMDLNKPNKYEQPLKTPCHNVSKTTFKVICGHQIINRITNQKEL